MKIAFVSSEVFPFSKTGGLGDVAGALPVELSKLGNNIKIFTPRYTKFLKDEFPMNQVPELGEIIIRVGENNHVVKIFSSFIPETSVPVYFVDCPDYFDRDKPYTTDPDEDERFILFQKSVIEIIQRLKWAPDIIHCNEWQTGLIPIYLKGNYAWDKLFEKTKTVFTIHNIAHQGTFDLKSLAKADIQHDSFLESGSYEFYGKINFLKTAILTADALNTVSETYAQELLTPELGAGMDPFLIQRKNDLCGILNGIDYNVWNPETDKLIPYNYSVGDLSNKIKNKKELLQRFNFAYEKNIPLIGIVSRLAEQKGFDIIKEGIDKLMSLDARWVILGDGSDEYKDLIADFMKRYPDKISVQFGLDDTLAHLIEAGADIFLMPSRFEPCGLNQIYSLKYGTVPVVRKTGGLADTVQDWNELISKGDESGTGFSFTEYSAEALIECMKRALKEFQNKSTWIKIQQNGMQKDFSWGISAVKYLDVYKRLSTKQPT